MVGAIPRVKVACMSAVVKFHNDNDRYNYRLQQLRQKSKIIATQEKLNAYLLLIPDAENRKAIFELMWPYLPFPCATCPDGPAHDVVGN